MTRLLRQVLSTMAYRTMQLAPSGCDGVRMLTYHRVTDAHPGDRLCVPVERFAAQMRHLHERGYRTISFAEAVAWVERGGSLPERVVVITFDDGFEDNVRYAYPAMMRYGLRGIFFVPSAFIEGGHDSHHPEDRPMSWAQLTELLRQGHEVGAHSVTHRKLATLAASEMAWEVHASKEQLERGLQRAVDFFCYPAGNYNESVKQAVKAAGYRGACTVEPGANRVGRDPFALKRTEVSAFDSLWDFEKKLAGAYDWLHVSVQSIVRIGLVGRRERKHGYEIGA